MPLDQTSTTVTARSGACVEAEIQRFIQARTQVSPAADQDLFATDLVSSLLAMELVIHLEQTYRIAVRGSNLLLHNFRSVRVMAELVLRLQHEPTDPLGRRSTYATLGRNTASYW